LFQCPRRLGLRCSDSAGKPNHVILTDADFHVPASIKDRIAGRLRIEGTRRSAGRVSGENISVHSAIMTAMSIVAPMITPNKIFTVVPIMMRSRLVETLPR
jgi:hypothetical protein